MEARATLRYARISPRKVSIVMDLIRNKPLAEAQAILQYTPKAALGLKTRKHHARSNKFIVKRANG